MDDVIESPVIRACWCSKSGKWGPPHDRTQCGAKHHEETLIGMRSAYNLLNAAHRDWVAMEDEGEDRGMVRDAYADIVEPSELVRDTQTGGANG